MTNPFGEADTAALSQHELFESYVRAGFSRAEALELIKVIVSEIMRSTLHEEKNDG